MEKREVPLKLHYSIDALALLLEHDRGTLTRATLRGDRAGTPQTKVARLEKRNGPRRAPRGMGAGSRKTNDENGKNRTGWGAWTGIKFLDGRCPF